MVEALAAGPVVEEACAVGVALAAAARAEVQSVEEQWVAHVAVEEVMAAERAVLPVVTEEVARVVAQRAVACREGAANPVE